MSSTTTPTSALDPRRPFCRADARRAGIPLARLLGPEFQRIFYDRYVSSTVVVTNEVRARTAVDLSPTGSFVSHHSAAEIWGGVVPVTAQTHVSVTDRADRSIRRGISAHLASAEHATTTLGGLPISTPEQTFVDLACGIDLVDLVILGDSLLHAGATTLQKLWSYVERWHGRGARPARLALRYVRAGAESPMETRLRLLVVLAGLPEPAVNYRAPHRERSLPLPIRPLLGGGEADPRVRRTSARRELSAVAPRPRTAGLARQARLADPGGDGAGHLRHSGPDPRRGARRSPCARRSCAEPLPDGLAEALSWSPVTVAVRPFCRQVRGDGARGVRAAARCVACAGRRGLAVAWTGSGLSCGMCGQTAAPRRSWRAAACCAACAGRRRPAAPNGARQPARAGRRAPCPAVESAQVRPPGSSAPRRRPAPGRRRRHPRSGRTRAPRRGSRGPRR